MNERINWNFNREGFQVIQIDSIGSKSKEKQEIKDDIENLHKRIVYAESLVFNHLLTKQHLNMLKLKLQIAKSKLKNFKD